MYGNSKNRENTVESRDDLERIGNYVHKIGIPCLVGVSVLFFYAQH